MSILSTVFGIFKPEPYRLSYLPCRTSTKSFLEHQENTKRYLSSPIYLTDTQQLVLIDGWGNIAHVLQGEIVDSDLPVYHMNMQDDYTIIGLGNGYGKKFIVRVLPPSLNRFTWWLSK